MAAKKYLVRVGFVVVLTLFKADGSGTYERTYEGGEEVTLDDDQAALHAHKLEFASQKDRDAALAAEKAAEAVTRSASSPQELVTALIAALAQSQASAPAPAPVA